MIVLMIYIYITYIIQWYYIYIIIVYIYIYILYIHIFQVFSRSQQSTATFFLCSPGRFSCRAPSSAALQTALWSNGTPLTKLCRGSHGNMWLKMGQISPNIWQFITEGYLFFRIFKDKIKVFLNYSCFSAVPASLPFCFSASRLFCFSAFRAFQFFCFSCFSAFLLFCFLAFLLPLFLFLQSCVLLLCFLLLLCFSASFLYCLFAFLFLLLYSLLYAYLMRPWKKNIDETQGHPHKNPKWNPKWKPKDRWHPKETLNGALKKP